MAPTSWDYEFLQDTDRQHVCTLLGQRTDEGWEPVGFSISPSGEYVALVRRKVQPKPSTFSIDNFGNPEGM